ncbi:Two-component system sensor histidine kinase, partial [hydrothermal vent metagenome]
MMIEILSFGISTVLFLILGLAMLTGKRDNLPKTMLALAALSSAVWSGTVSYQAYQTNIGLQSDVSTAVLLELFRALSWFAFLIVMLRTAYKSSDQVNKNFKVAFGGISVFILGLMLLALYRISDGLFFEIIAGHDVLIGHLLISIGGLVVIEQLYRNTTEEHRRALKYLWFAIGGMFAYDFYLYADALLFQRIDEELWDSRGFIHAMVVPLIGVAIKREMQWSIADTSIDIYLSRSMAFHTTTLLVSGVYLLLIGVGGYYVKEMGGNWGAVAQSTFLFASVMALIVLLFSGKIRSRLKIAIDKHFFHYKYDYREEWLRIIQTLSSQSESAGLHERSIRALAQIIDSPGGLLMRYRQNGCYELDACWNYEQNMVRESDESELVKFLSEQQFVICLDEYNKDPQMYTRLGALSIPIWISSNPEAWLIVPLMLKDELMGFVVLLRSPAHQRYFNWEDSDLLRTAGRQAASHLAQYDAAQALVSARRFEEVNKLSAFIVHDIKNMVGQLSMVVSNAARHKSNPMFIDDAIITVENTVNKMNKLLLRLRVGKESEEATPISLCSLLEESIRSCVKAGTLPIPVLNCLHQKIQVMADK